MIAMTTSNSIKVKASVLLVSWGTNQEITGILAPANTQLFTEPLPLSNAYHHMVVETPRGNLVAGMKWFLGTYRRR
jgi:hypothetical protein